MDVPEAPPNVAGTMPSSSARGHLTAGLTAGLMMLCLRRVLESSTGTTGYCNRVQACVGVRFDRFAQMMPTATDVVLVIAVCVLNLIVPPKANASTEKPWPNFFGCR